MGGVGTGVGPCLFLPTQRIEHRGTVTGTSW